MAVNLTSRRVIGDGRTADAPLMAQGITFGADKTLTYSCASTVYEQDDSGVYVPWAANVRPWNSARGTTVNPAATNLITQSQLASGWGIDGGSVVSIDSGIRGIISGLNKRKITENSVAATHELYTSVTKAASALQYTFSVMLEPNGRSKSLIRIQSGAGGVEAVFDFSAGTITTAVAATGTGWTAGYALILPEGNGVYRCVVSGTSDASTSIVSVIKLHNGTSTFYTGDGTSGVYIHHAQLEQSAYHTSPIPTAGSTQTRSAATCTIPASNLPSDNYVVYGEVTNGQSTTAALVGWGQGSATDVDWVANDSATIFSCKRRRGGALGGINSATMPSTFGVMRFSTRYTGGLVVMAVNGVMSNSIAVSPPSNVNGIGIGTNNYGAAQYPVSVRNLRIYPALTDAQLTKLTTEGML